MASGSFKISDYGDENTDHFRTLEAAGIDDSVTEKNHKTGVKILAIHRFGSSRENEIRKDHLKVVEHVRYTTNKADVVSNRDSVSDENHNIVAMIDRENPNEKSCINVSMGTDTRI